MPIRLVVTKQTATGEQVQIDVVQWNPVTGDMVHSDIAELSQLVDDAMDIVDVRTEEMGIRVLEAYNLDKYFDPPTWSRVVSILDIISGKQSAATVSARWQSEVEETAELEAGRAAYSCNVNPPSKLALL